MGYWSKLWLNGELIATHETAGVEILITLENAVTFALLKQDESGIVIAASKEYLEDQTTTISYELEFTGDDLDNLANDNALRGLFDNGYIRGAYLGGNEVIGNWYTIMGFPGGYAITLPTILEQLSAWSAPQSTNDLRPTKKEIEVNVGLSTLDLVPPDEIFDRSKLDYRLSVNDKSGNTILNIHGREEPESDSGCMMEIGWLLNQKLYYVLPQKKTDVVFKHKGHTGRFILQESVYYNGSIDSNYAAKQLDAIKAGLNEEDFANWPQRIYSEYIGKYGRWLTWQPNNMVVGLKQPVYLSYLTNRRPVPMKLMLYCQVFFEDLAIPDTVDLGYEYFEAFSLDDVSENEVISWAMGYEQLGLGAIRQANGDRAITHYTCWLVDQSFRRVSRKRTFYPDYKTREDERNFVFTNSLGGVDSVRMYGGTTEVLSIAGKGAYRSMSTSYNTLDEEYFVRNKSGQISIKVNTGLLERKWLQYMEELAWSEKIVLETQSGFVAVINENASYPKPAKSDRIGSRDFEFIKSKDVVSKESMPLATEKRIMAWVGAGAYCQQINGVNTGKKGFTFLELHYVDVLPSVRVPGVAKKVNVVDDADYIEPFDSADC